MNRTQRARRALEALRGAIPQPETELEFADPYQLIVAVILSAQCTDERVNKVTPALFEAFPTVEHLARAAPEEVFPYIRSVSYPNNKAKHLVGMAGRVVAVYGGEVPQELDALVSLPGVGRKTAQVVQSVAFSMDALPVDTHVFRVANRIGLTQAARTPQEVERQLKALLPRDAWSEAHHLLILHGRYTCTARAPKCDVCPVAPACLYYERLQKLPPPRADLNPARGRYYSPTSDRYFDEPEVRRDRYGVEQLACPFTGSMNVYDTKTGRTTRRVPDYRV